MQVRLVRPSPSPGIGLPARRVETPRGWRRRGPRRHRRARWAPRRGSSHTGHRPDEHGNDEDARQPVRNQARVRSATADMPPMMSTTGWDGKGGSRTELRQESAHRCGSYGGAVAARTPAGDEHHKWRRGQTGKLIGHVSGSCTSSRTMSGRSRCTTAISSWPVDAHPTTAKPSSASNAEAEARNSGLCRRSRGCAPLTIVAAGDHDVNRADPVNRTVATWRVAR